MRKIRNVLALFLALFLVVLSLPSAVSADDTDMRFGRSILASMNNSEGLLYVYDRLVDGCLNAEEKISVANDRNPILWDDVRMVYLAFHSDYPEYFWVKNSYKGTVGGDTGYVKTISPQYFMTGNELAAAKNKFNKKVAELTEGLSSKSDYEKSLILHDRLAKNTEYVHSANNQNAYGSLVDGEAVCAGYSKGYQCLLNAVGIEAWAVIGNSISPAGDTPVAHEWNMVRLDGDWYFTDVTWDDQDSRIYYACFNMTSSVMKERHEVVDFKEYIPETNATKANYFYKNNLVFSSFSAAPLAEALKKNNLSVSIFVSGNVDKFIDDVHDNIFKVVKDAGVAADREYSYMMYQLGREVFLQINVIEKNHVHKLESVCEKKPSCIQKGSKAYYSCNCGKWFSDAEGKNEITDKESLVLKAVEHKPSGYKSDDSAHWKQCTECKAEIANSRQNHFDADKNSKCDACGKSLSAAESTASVPVSSTAATSSLINSDSSNSGAPTSSQNTDTTSKTESNSETIEIITEEEETGFKLQKEHIWMIAGLGAGVIVISAVLIILFRGKKK